MGHRPTCWETLANNIHLFFILYWPNVLSFIILIHSRRTNLDIDIFSVNKFVLKKHEIISYILRFLSFNILNKFSTDVFEPFLKEYYDHFKHQSIDSFDFKSFFLEYFQRNDNLNRIDWDTWFKAPGMPKIKPRYDDSLLQVKTNLSNKIENLKF